MLLDIFILLVEILMTKFLNQVCGAMHYVEGASTSIGLLKDM